MNSDTTAPFVSVIIPAYNAEQWIGESIKSVLGGSFQAIELIVIDDGSTDGTWDVLVGWGNSIVRRSQPNSGPCSARNAGLRLARGKFIKFLDADDILHPDTFSAMIYVAQLCVTAPFVTSLSVSFHGNNVPLSFGCRIRPGQFEIKDTLSVN